MCKRPVTCHRFTVTIAEVAMADQNERAFQKQPTIPLNRKGGLKPGEARFMCNPGLGFKTPAEARTGNYIDKKCPFTGKVGAMNSRVLWLSVSWPLDNFL